MLSKVILSAIVGIIFLLFIIFFGGLLSINVAIVVILVYFGIVLLFVANIYKNYRREIHEIDSQPL